MNDRLFSSPTGYLFLGLLAPAWASPTQQSLPDRPGPPSQASGLVGSPTAFGPACANQPDDIYEDNDNCLQGVTLGPGLHPDLHVKLTDWDYYWIAVPPQSSLDITFPTGAGDISIVGFQGCSYQVTGTSSTGFALSNPEMHPWTILFHVRPIQGDCADYSIDIQATPDPCLVAPDDGFEDYDACDMALPITAGTYLDRVVFNWDDDFYSISVGPGQTLRWVETADSHRTSYSLSDAMCAAPLQTDEESLEYTNLGSQSQTVFVQAATTVHSVPGCATYDFMVTLEDSPCFTLPDDAYEPNEDCASAAPLVDGVYQNLLASAGSPDFYTVCVPAGEWLNVTTEFSHAAGDLNLYLYDANASFCGALESFLTLDSSTSLTDDESVAWFNATGAAADVVIAVRVHLPNQNPCNTYELMVSGAADCVGALVTYYCDPMDPNSTGLPTLLVAGLGNPAGSGLRLQALFGPPSEFAYFLVGTGASSPGLALGDGRMCLRTSAPNLIGRYNVVGTPQNSLGQFDAQGIFQNLSGTSIAGSGFDVPWNLPLPGNPTIQLGETWYFQLWHRDGQGSSNFSGAAAVRF